MNKIEWEMLIKEWNTANKFYLLLAVLSFLTSQIFSVFRVDLFFKKAEVNLSFANNARLYLLGMFYNFFIPGGVGGDAYKVIALNKAYQKPIKTLTSAVFFDRFIGLCAICILICLSIFLVPLDISIWFKYLIFLIGILSSIIGPFILGKWFPRFRSVFFSSLIYSFIIQGFQIGTILFSLLALNVEVSFMVYVVIFLISSILSIISFAGIGIRETFFYYAATYMNFNADISAAIALIFSAISLIVSLFGIIYFFKKIKFN